MTENIYKIHFNTNSKCDCDFQFGVNVHEKHLNCHAKLLKNNRVRIYILWEIIRDHPMDSLQDMRSEKAVDVITNTYEQRNAYEFPIMQGFPIRGTMMGWSSFEFVWEEDTAKHK